MAEKYFEEAKAAGLRNWGLKLMLKGAGGAMVGLIVVIVTMMVVWGFGQFLPSQSKEMPSPFGALEAPYVIVTTIVT
jgi:hypothetical protein